MKKASVNARRLFMLLSCCDCLARGRENEDFGRHRGVVVGTFPGVVASLVGSKFDLILAAAVEHDIRTGNL